MSKTFNNLRLQQARIIRGMTIEDLADATNGISKQAISQYEIGKFSPPLEKIFQIAGILRFPVSFFYDEDKVLLKTGTTYFRALASTSKRERMAQVYRTEYIMKLYTVLGKYVEFPQLNLPRQTSSSISPEEEAKNLRKFWGITGPIHNIIYWMERNGICVTSLPTGTEKIDAFSQIGYNDIKEIVCVVLGSEKESAVRRQFCAAHEIGHMIMHESIGDVEALSTAEFREKENEAHDFAGAFLLPADEFSKDLMKYDMRLDTFITLKKKWHVSIGAMIIRGKKLGIIDDVTYIRLMKSYSARGWRTSEPLDDQIIIENPVLAQKAINILLENDVFSVQELIEEFSKNGVSLGLDFIEEALCLKKGTLTISSKENDIKPIEVPLKKM